MVAREKSKLEDVVPHAAMLLLAGVGAIVAWWQLVERLGWSLHTLKKYGHPYRASLDGTILMVLGCGLVVATGVVVGRLWPRGFWLRRSGTGVR